MKRFLIAFLAFLSTHMFAQENSWKFVGSTEDSKSYYRYNSPDTGWIKIISSKTKYFTKGTTTPKIIDGYTIILTKFDCDKRRLGNIQITTYTKSGKLLSSYSFEDYEVNMYYVIPDSIGESELNAHCFEE